MTERRQDRLNRFWRTFEVWGSGCWIWAGLLTPTGYGVTKWQGKGARRVHHIVWELLIGPRPAGLETDHLCRMRACANPDHIEWVTRRENVRRAFMARGVRNYNGAKTHCPQGHDYDEENTAMDRGRRRCRKCHRQDSAQRRVRVSV